MTSPTSVGHGMAARQPDATHSESRRDFLRLAALAGASSALVPRAARRAWAQETPQKGGTLRGGFYIEAATMDPHLSGSKIDRQGYHNNFQPLLVLDRKLGVKP